MNMLERLKSCLRFDEENPTESESEKAIRAAIKEIGRYKDAMQGWEAYGWKNGEYIDDLNEYFDEILNQK